jgi:hypothetical protein
MSNGRPRLLLVPGLCELQWVIKPKLSEWADVISFDPPGVGEQRQPDIAELAQDVDRWSKRGAQIGLSLVDDRGWTDFALIADGLGIPEAARIGGERPGAVRALALGHACLIQETEGEDASINREVWAAMNQLLNEDYASFVAHGITQLTAGAYGPGLAGGMLERIPMEFADPFWAAVEHNPNRFGERFTGLDCPKLIARHDGCLFFTERGFEDAAAALPDATSISTPEAPSVSDGFAGAIRELCEPLDWS